MGDPDRLKFPGLGLWTVESAVGQIAGHDIVVRILLQNLNVVKGVKAKVPFGASNRLADYEASYEQNRKKIEGPNPGPLDKVLGAMTFFLPLMTGANRAQQIYNEKTGQAPSNPIERFRQVANITVKSKAGNCNEQSIVAFMDLYDMGIRPLA